MEYGGNTPHDRVHAQRLMTASPPHGRRLVAAAPSLCPWLPFFSSLGFCAHSIDCSQSELSIAITQRVFLILKALDSSFTWNCASSWGDGEGVSDERVSLCFSSFVLGRYNCFLKKNSCSVAERILCQAFLIFVNELWGVALDLVCDLRLIFLLKPSIALRAHLSLFPFSAPIFASLLSCTVRGIWEGREIWCVSIYVGFSVFWYIETVRATFLLDFFGDLSFVVWSKVHYFTFWRQCSFLLASQLGL